MKVAALLLLALCQLSFGAYFREDEYELDRLRKFLTRELSNHVRDTTCSAPVDIVFLLDRSRSIWGPNFELEKKFVQDIVRMFDPETARFGVLTWAEGADVMIKFGTHGSNQDALIRDIGAITQRPEIGGSTETWAVLRLLREQVLTRQTRRKEATPIAILITDGASQKKELTASEAAAVHEAGITVFAIGIKEREMDVKELKTIASDPDSAHAFMLENWEEAAKRLKEIGSMVCPSNIEGCEHNRALDLVFSLSGWSTKAETTSAMSLVKGVVGAVTMGPGQVQVGLAPRVCTASWTQITLDAHDTKEGFNEDLDTRASGMGNNLQERFAYLTQKAFSAENGGQGGSDAGKVAVVIVDEKDEISRASSQAKRLRREGVKVIVIAVGDVTANDVTMLTGANDIIHVSSYENISGIESDLLKKLCEAQKYSS